MQTINVTILKFLEESKFWGFHIFKDICHSMDMNKSTIQMDQIFWMKNLNGIKFEPPFGAALNTATR